MGGYNEYKGLNLPGINKEILAKWIQEDTFKKSIETRQGSKPFVFFEGPPSANGMPGIHHVMARTLKDLFCRYKTLTGHQVVRKAGWDTHGLPIELGVEKELGITKEDIGKTITVEEYNAACRKAVMRYTDAWNKLTETMGYWVDMDSPYVTYENKYIESVWWLLNRIYSKDLLYKGYTIQPYSPKAGTGLSTHELNQPGCYKDVTDMSAIAQFRVKEGDLKNTLFGSKPIHILAWTTTPWTLPSNTALCVGPNIEYSLIRTLNSYSAEEVFVVLASARISAYFKPENKDVDFTSWNPADKSSPWQEMGTFKGSSLTGLKYEQLLPYALPEENPQQAFRVISGDFVTTEDGTGIVHIAPTFGADDMKVARDAGVPAMLVKDEHGKLVPLVDLRGRFRLELADPVFGLGGEYVKEDYLTEEEKTSELGKQKVMLQSIISDTSKLKYLSVDERITLKLQHEGKLFKKEKYVHSYPHCWRTDKPIIYYPLDSWFIRIPKVRERMAELNNKIQWKPTSTGTGRFGNWLETAGDWNLSRSRFWGIPLPLWRTEDSSEIRCISTVSELKNAINEAILAGYMEENPLQNFVEGDMSEQNYKSFDLHKHVVDRIVLVSPKGKPMYRETDLIDVWFDSGAMPYAQWHYPMENKDLIDNHTAFPADFIAEGVDQTRGWFYTLHAIATMCFDSVAYKNVISNGLVLDKNGQKMSKRLGNAVDPFETLEKFGADATRWYMISNAQPWDNLKFDEEGILEVQRKFFGTLYNTYSFFALYANLDAFKYQEPEIPLTERPELDRWILSRLHSLVKQVKTDLDQYEPTRAARLIQDFVNDDLSNWYVRLCRRRFWKGEYGNDKIAAYQTLYTCLETVAILASPIAPFFCERLFCDLNTVSKKLPVQSVHLAFFPNTDETKIDLRLERKMSMAQQISSMVLSIRKTRKIKVRQPLQRIMVPVLDSTMADEIKEVQEIILSEVNVKQLELLTDATHLLVKKIKPNFKTIGPRYGKQMKGIAAMVQKWSATDILAIEQKSGWKGLIDNEEVILHRDDFEITAQDIPGWEVAVEGNMTVALDITITDQLKDEGIAREVVNRIQNLRKDSNFEVSDRILITIQSHPAINHAIETNLTYICAETLADNIQITDNELSAELVSIEEGVETRIVLKKVTI